jgi:hypothetical protein
MTNEALKLMQSKRDCGLIILMYTINILMDFSIYVMKFIIISEIILHDIDFVKLIIVDPKNQNWYPKLNIPCF